MIEIPIHVVCAALFLFVAWTLLLFLGADYWKRQARSWELAAQSHLESRNAVAEDRDAIYKKLLSLDKDNFGLRVDVQRLREDNVILREELGLCQQSLLHIQHRTKLFLQDVIKEVELCMPRQPTSPATTSPSGDAPSKDA